MALLPIKSSVLLPPMRRLMATAAVESGSFLMNLFRGKAALDQMFPYRAKLSGDDRSALQKVLTPVEKLLTVYNDPFMNDVNERIPQEMITRCAKLGAFGPTIPKEYGGLGLSNTQTAIIVEHLGANDLALGVTLAAQNIGHKGILLYGTREQKEKYLPDIASGKKFAAFCLTEPVAGSDANSIVTRAVKSESGDHYILNGSKIWISNGGFADVFTVFAQTGVEQPDGSVKDRISAFIVERAFEGVTSGPPEKKMGIRASDTAAVRFENVKVPAGNLLGEEGIGFKVAMNVLNNGRFALLAACVGSMRQCITKTIDHVNTITRFGRKLRDFGNVQEKLTDMILRHYSTESVLYSLASTMDSGAKEFQLEAAIGKFLSSENAWQVCDDAIQLHGGLGFMRKTGLERVMRDLRVFRIFEGTNDILRLFVALTGLKQTGQHLKKTLEEVKGGNLHTLSREIKYWFTGRGEISIAHMVHPALGEEARAVEAVINQFGVTVRRLLKLHREGVIERQYEVIRVANACADIYSMVAVLSRCSQVLDGSGGEVESVPDLKIAKLYISQTSRRTGRDLEEAHNPRAEEVGLIGDISREMCHSQGITYQHPSDV